MIFVVLGIVGLTVCVVGFVASISEIIDNRKRQ
jgi:hypothetical protein